MQHAGFRSVAQTEKARVLSLDSGRGPCVPAEREGDEERRESGYARGGMRGRGGRWTRERERERWGGSV